MRRIQSECNTLDESTSPAFTRTRVFLLILNYDYYHIFQIIIIINHRRKHTQRYY